MSIWPEARRTAALLLGALLLGAAQADARFPNVGRAATAAEIRAWDIDVRPDFKGLPAGSGSVSQGMQIWEAQCASCHGIFGESNEVFAPIVGGTSADDLRSGRVARLTDPSFPGRTTLMKLSTVSTLWDYIHRAMPWTQPKSLSADEVYAVTAYVLHLGGVLPADFVLHERNIAAVQARLPNRNGTTTDHGLWPGKGLGNGGRPDVRASACMRNCGGEPRLVSDLPPHARNAHGNLAEQNRAVGAQHGVDTRQPAPEVPSAAPPAAPVAAPPPAAAALPSLLKRHNCMACHGIDKAVVGPALQAVARKHAARSDLETYLQHKIKAGSQGVWGAIPMPPQALSEAEAATIAAWIARGAARLP